MGQYFKLVNVNKKEFVSLPGGMKAIERVTNGVAMGMIGYLLLEGPQDGTAFKYRMDEDDPRLQSEIEEKIEQEKELEEETERESMYRDDDGEWMRDRLATVAAAGFEISDANEYAGRWARDEITLVGDYAEGDLYGTTSEEWVYEYDGEEFTNHATSSAPIVPESIERDDTMHSTERRDVEEGDFCYIYHPELEDEVYAHFVEVADSEWTNITDGLEEEFANFVGEEWLENNGGGLLRPDMVVQG